MSQSVSPIPAGYHSVTPYLIVPDAVAAMEFYSQAFGAGHFMRMPGPGGQGTMHAEMKIGDSIVMLSDENPQWEMKSPGTLGGSPVSLMIYVEDVDAAFARAVAAGCEVKFPVTHMFWGDRMGKLADPYGYQWSLASHVEEVPEAEMAARQQAWLEEMAKAGCGEN